MAGHPQSSPRGLFAKKKILVGDIEIAEAVTGLTISTDIDVTGDVGATTVTATGAITSGGFTMTGNSTCLKLETRTALPTTRQVGGICFVFNSTVRALAFHSTGTTWVYADSTT